jgi:mRNA interferase HicA
MKGSEFLKRIRKPAKHRGLAFEWHPNLGKGSHGVLKVGDRRTVLRNPRDELKTGTLRDAQVTRAEGRGHLRQRHA